MFERTFQVAGNGTLSASRDHLVKGQRLYIRYRTLVRSHTGMVLQIPTLCFKYSSDSSIRMRQINKNKNAMFGLFVAVYGAYCTICKNMGWENRYTSSLNLANGIDIQE